MKIGLPSDVKPQTPVAADEKARDDDATDEESRGEEEKVEQPAITADMLAHAEDLGFSKEEAEELGATALKKALVAMDRKLAGSARPAPKGEAEGTQVPQPKVETKTETPIEAPKLSEEVKKLLEPEVAQYLESLEQKLSAVQGIGELQQRLAQMQDYIAVQEEQRFEAWFDDQLGKLSAYEDVFGKGRGLEMDRAGKEFANRVALIEEMQALEQGYRATGRRVPDQDTLLKRALSSLHGERAEARARKEINEKLQTRKQRFLAKPTHREANGHKDPTLSAESAIAAKLRDWGADDE